MPKYDLAGNPMPEDTPPGDSEAAAPQIRPLDMNAMYESDSDHIPTIVPLDVQTEPDESGAWSLNPGNQPAAPGTNPPGLQVQGQPYQGPPIPGPYSVAGYSQQYYSGPDYRPAEQSLPGGLPQQPYAVQPTPAAFGPYAQPHGQGNQPNVPPSGYSLTSFVTNNSGTQGEAPVEVERLRWNWGAFFMNRLWLYWHGMSTLASILWGTSIAVFWGALLLGPAIGSALQSVYWLINLGISFYLGFNGHHMAWRNRRFDDLQQFFSVQRAWMVAGFVFWGITSLLRLLFFVVAYEAARDLANEQPASSIYSNGGQTYGNNGSGYNGSSHYGGGTYGGNNGSGAATYGNSSGASSSPNTGDDTNDDSGQDTSGSTTGTSNGAEPIQGFAPTNNNNGSGSQ